MNTKKILIIDDDRDVLYNYKELLELEPKLKDYEIIVAEEGIEGLRIANNERPKLILLDVVIPDMGGQEILKKIKDKNIPTRVIMMSGLKISTKDVVDFTRLGVCGYLFKPFGKEELYNTVERALIAESTINFHISNSPTIEQLINNIQELQSDKEKLQSDNNKLQQYVKKIIKDNEKLKKQPFIRELLEEMTWFSIRLFFLAICAGFCFILLSLNIILPNIQFVLATLGLFVAICIPIQKIKNLSIKVPSAETDIEIHDEQ
jgi:DNA-binding response OmpR family regulator